MAKHFHSESTVLKSEQVSIRGGRIAVAGDERSVDVGVERLLVGRGPQCALVLDDKTVSAVHVEVQATPKGVRLIDLDSRNGTFLGETRVHEVFLNGPCEFRCGDTLLRFTPSDPQQVALSQDTRFGPLIGTTPEMLGLFAKLRQFAKSDLSVVITGETGTGKELAARAIHEASPRRGKPFVAVNCAAMTDSLLEAELFGHTKGAFTGADRARSGLFVEADGGTLFLDEVAEMSSAMQAKLLRVLQEGEVRPVGASQTRKVNVRTLFATHANLAEAVNKSAFRQDLFFRIAVLTVEIPPLRKRLDDLPFLIKRILEDLRRPDAKINSTSITALKARTWPGNVRELRNAVAVALAASEGEGQPLSFDEAVPLVRIKNDDAPLETKKYDDAMAEAHRRYYTALHALCRGNVTQIAKLADKERATVRTHLKRAGLHVTPDTNSSVPASSDEQ